MVSLLGRPPNQDQRELFVKRVRPPGWWQRDPARQARELRRAIAGILLAALSVFCVLIGIATWMLDSPVPFGVMPSAAYAALLVAVGLALIPGWLARMHPEVGPSADADS